MLLRALSKLIFFNSAEDSLIRLMMTNETLFNTNSMFGVLMFFRILYITVLCRISPILLQITVFRRKLLHIAVKCDKFAVDYGISR